MRRNGTEFTLIVEWVNNNPKYEREIRGPPMIKPPKKGKGEK